MITVFKGAAPGTHWWNNDPRMNGFVCAAGKPLSVPAIIRHITGYSFPSPYLSFSASFAVARSYALMGPAGPASVGSPGYVYEADIDPDHVTLFHPCLEILQTGCSEGKHLHDGGPDLLLGIAAPDAHPSILVAAPPRTATHSGSAGPPNGAPPRYLTELQAVVFALRDAEILATSVPAGCIIRRHDVF